MKYYVVDRYRQGIDIKYLNEELSNGRLRRVFDTYADAKKYLEGCFSMILIIVYLVFWITEHGYAAFQKHTEKLYNDFQYLYIAELERRKG